MHPVVAIKDLSKHYARRHGEPLKAVQAMTLTLQERGQIFGLLGTNGAGKTTTIKMMCGLVTPTSGTVALNGYDIKRQKAQAMRQIGAVLEGARNIYWRLSAWQNLMYYGRLKQLSGKTLRKRADYLLAYMELADRKHDMVGEFSRGMQQKIAIACALIADPPILLLDEPTLGLDVQAARSVRQALQTLAQDEGKSIILTTHQLDMAQVLCDRIVIMHRGRVMADKPKSELLQLPHYGAYEVRLDGVFDVSHFQPLFIDMAIDLHHDAAVTVLSNITTQTALYRVLAFVDALDLPLIAAQKVEPRLEDVFLQIAGQQVSVSGMVADNPLSMGEGGK